MKSLEELTMEELLQEVEVAINERTLWLTFGKSGDNQILKDFGDLIQEPTSAVIRTPNGGRIEIPRINKKPRYVDLFIKYEDKADKKALIGSSLYVLLEQLQENGDDISKEDKKNYEKYVKKFIQLIGKRNFNMIYTPLRAKKSKKVYVINSQELVECAKSGRSVRTLITPTNKVKNKLDRIKQVELAKMIGIIGAEDYSSISMYGEELADAIRDTIVYNYDMRLKEKEKAGLEPKLKIKEYNQIVADVIQANIRYISLDKLCLILAYKYLQEIEDEKYDGQREEYEGILNFLRNNIEKGTKVTIFEGKDEDDTYEPVGEYSLEDLTKDMQRFTEKGFVTKKEIENAERDLLSGKKSLEELDDKVFRFLNITSHKIGLLIELSEENVRYLIEIGVMSTQTEFYHALYLRGKCSNELLDLAIQKNIVDGRYVLYLYSEGMITLDNIEYVLEHKGDKSHAEDKETEQEDKQELIDEADLNDKIRELYGRVIDEENEDLDKDIDEFYKFIDLYKLLNVKGKTEEEIAQASNSLIESFGDDLDSKVLEQLYQYGLIRLKDAAEWGVNLKKMLVQGDIRPTDLKALYGEGAIRIEEIKNALTGEIMPYEEKLDLIYSTFDGESEEEYEIRDKLIQLLETGEEYKDGGHGTTKGLKEQEGQEEKEKEKKPKGREYVSDPHARWKFLSLLDKDYSKMFVTPDMKVSVSDGHRIFLLPNLDSVIIEKMLEKRGGRQVSSYAAATYILDRKTFTKFMVAIVEDEKVIRTTLGDLARGGVATKIIHNKTWGENIKKYFGIDKENERYSEEEIAQIDRAIELVEKSKQERE